MPSPKEDLPRRAGVPCHVKEETTEKHLTPEFWQKYNEAPVVKDEFIDEKPDEPELKPSDWENPAYREEYARRAILRESTSTYWIVQASKHGSKHLAEFIDQRRGAGLTVHHFDATRGTYVVEISEKLAREMKAQGFTMQQITPSRVTKRGR